MRLVIQSRGAAAAGLKRYDGAGIFCLIGRQLYASGLKKVINGVDKESPSQKLADVVVNRAPPSGKKKKKKKSREVVKRKLATPTTESSPKIAKLSQNTINQLINARSGSGIVLD